MPANSQGQLLPQGQGAKGAGSVSQRVGVQGRIWGPIAIAQAGAKDNSLSWTSSGGPGLSASGGLPAALPGSVPHGCEQALSPGSQTSSSGEDVLKTSWLPGHIAPGKSLFYTRWARIPHCSSNNHLCKIKIFFWKNILSFVIALCQTRTSWLLSKFEHTFFFYYIISQLFPFLYVFMHSVCPPVTHHSIYWHCSVTASFCI